MGRLIDLTGQRFGSMVVIERASDSVSKRGNRQTRWLCRCDCGVELKKHSSSLRGGTTTSCKHCRVYVDDLTGKEFGKWTVIERAKDRVTKNDNKFTIWLCECDCGNLSEVWANNLTSGTSTQCLDCDYSTRESRIDNHRDLVGRRFGRLVVKERKDKPEHRSGRRNIAWICECDCGGESWVSSAGLLYGDSITSCGCKQKEATRSRAKEDRTQHLIGRVLKDYKGNAKKRGLKFELSKRELQSLIMSPCFYCGEEHSNEKSDNIVREKGDRFIGSPSLKYNGIDRIDNSKGYNIKNCIPCCATCNRMKSDSLVEDFLKQVITIDNHIN